MKYLVFAAALSLSAAQASAVTIGAQDFEGNTTGTGITSNSALGTAPGTVFDGTGLGWSLSYSGGGPISGETNGDLIGVVNATSPVTAGSNDLDDAAGITGNYFLADDVDGILSLVFEAVDARRFADLVLDFSFAVAAESYESSDSFEVLVNETSVFSVAGDDLESGAFVDTFTTTSLDLSGFDRSILSVVVQFSNSAGGEDIGFDNLKIQGTAVPLPAGLPLLLAGLGAFGLIARRRAA